ncbi:hypothetical protein BV898_00307 [Hypsibius exemplaris]|uniref:Uncharacterized protein n=1 Tax=Hypsibius exemplaris TaxID=2072580 RepID=A0A1W0XFE5_HYPEX|nr:hypothetical protein BV898_00307 [Hypsibius exemplaris]
MLPDCNLLSAAIATVSAAAAGLWRSGDLRGYRMGMAATPEKELRAAAASSSSIASWNNNADDPAVTSIGLKEHEWKRHKLTLADKAASEPLGPPSNFVNRQANVICEVKSSSSET